MPIDSIMTLNVKDAKSKAVGLINHETMMEQAKILSVNGGKLIEEED